MCQMRGGTLKVPFSCKKADLTMDQGIVVKVVEEVVEVKETIVEHRINFSSVILTVFHYLQTI